MDPTKPMLKPPGAKHSKLKCDILLSTIAFKFNLRRYSMAERSSWNEMLIWPPRDVPH